MIQYPKPTFRTKEKTNRKELQQIYKETFDKVYHEERSEYLKNKAKEDAKKAANKPRGFLNSIIELITGGRAKP